MRTRLHLAPKTRFAPAHFHWLIDHLFWFRSLSFDFWF